MALRGIVLAGGVTSLPGFGPRLLDEINMLLYDPKYSELKSLQFKFRVTPSVFPKHIHTWVGGRMDLHRGRGCSLTRMLGGNRFVHRIAGMG